MYCEEHGTVDCLPEGTEDQDMPWIPCNSWEDLPRGVFLVKTDNVRNPYQVADARNKNIVLVGNHFVWDSGSLIAYREFEPYEP